MYVLDAKLILCVPSLQYVILPIVYGDHIDLVISTEFFISVRVRRIENSSSIEVFNIFGRNIDSASCEVKQKVISNLVIWAYIDPDHEVLVI